MLSVWEPGEHIISGPKVGKKNEEEKSHFESLDLVAVCATGPGLIHGWIFWVIVLDCFPSIDVNSVCKQL